MFSTLFNSVFGCSHQNYSFPRTVKRGNRTAAASVTGTYVVCLECGKELPYDWRQMKVVSPKESARGLAKPAESYAGK